MARLIIDEEAKKALAEGIPEGMQPADVIDRVPDARPLYAIKEGHGRFAYRVTDEGCIIYFCLTDKYRVPGTYDDLRELNDGAVPLFGVLVQSMEKAKAIAAAFMRVGEYLEEGRASDAAD